MKDPETYQDPNGYLRYKDSNYLVHRRRMESILHRNLVPGEIVHHINGNKLDNSPENLILLSGEQHYKIHVLPQMQERKEAQIKEKLIRQVGLETAKVITTALAIGGAILFALGLLTRTKLDLWYIGLVFLIAALAAWYFVLRRNES
jgi:hypothetical protein